MDGDVRAEVAAEMRRFVTLLRVNLRVATVDSWTLTRLFDETIDDYLHDGS